MADSKVKVVNNSICGGLWFVGWLFTLGFLKLTFWKGVLALLLWPYYLGVHFGIPCESLIK
ncbi:MAG: hypothetical protein KDC52_01430 [Ignavibacteriae bacterium]|nr:hypothetical protein [Ignavibacteriota bacterium]MCB0750113.1 hypothetical protein [Ignavibacteriota bacterium]MCB9258231.1 hypothetical protein [Ignavibacteriales bacterium]